MRNTQAGAVALFLFVVAMSVPLNMAQSQIVSMNSGLRNFLIEEMKLDYEASTEKAHSTRVGVTKMALPNGHRIVLAFVTGGGWCGATGNCTMLVLEQKGHSYSKITVIRGLDVPIRRLGTSSNGMPDLGAWAHGGAESYYERRWRFNGKVYVDAGAIDGYLNGKPVKKHVRGTILIGDRGGELLYR